MSATLQRRPLVKKILAGADDNLLVIAGLGSSNWDVTEAGDRPLNMPMWGGMGAPVGMGLGLALARAILEKNRGTVSVTSRPGEGTAFTLRLTAAPE